MSSIAFVDSEIDKATGRILDIGCIRDNGAYFHSNSVPELIKFIQDVDFICGHNIFYHDLKFLGKALLDAGINPENSVDTLFLSPLLFPAKPYHALEKDYKLQLEESNSPLTDAIITRDPFF